MTVAGGLLKSFEGAKDYSKMKLKDKISLVIEDMNFMKKVRARRNEANDYQI